jgi:hypothetical protein
MDTKDVTKFKGLHEAGKLLKPEQPGNVMAKLAVADGEGGGWKGLSGQFLR